MIRMAHSNDRGLESARSHALVTLISMDRRMLVEMTGIEPVTSGLQSRRSPN